jgi:Zn-dependent peptidase ImmA (M78 family)
MNSKFSKSIELRALKILEETGSLSAPVPIERVVKRLGLTLQPAELGEDVSGILVVQGETGTIGFNAHQAPVRQRFSIAHEVGHFVLHHKLSNIFIDKKYTTVFLRDKSSETGEYRREVQANQFAASLLMPKSLLVDAIQKSKVDIADEHGLKQLADHFEVSTQALSLRLARLGMIRGA